MFDDIKEMIGFGDEEISKVPAPIRDKHTPKQNYYAKLYRVADKGKRTYSKIVKQEKADRLLNGKQMVGKDGVVVRVPLKRKYVRA